MRKYQVKDYFGILFLILLIITGAITLTILFVPLYQMTLGIHNIPEQVGMSYETIMDNYYVLLEYLHSPFMSELSFPDFPSSQSGLFHFYEVKRLFFVNYGTLIISGIISFIYMRHLKKTNRYYILRRPFFVAIWAPFFLLGLLVLNFNQVFLVFHQILFNNDAWIFNPSTDPIINVLPEQFFMYCFIFAFLVMEVSIISIYYYSKRKVRKN